MVATKSKNLIPTKNKLKSKQSKKLAFGWRAKLHDKRYLAGAATIVLFAAVGSYLLIFSKAATSSNGFRYNSLTPARLVDTRPGSGQSYAGQTIGPNQTISVQIGGKGGVPASGVGSVVLNVTAVAPSADTFISTYANASARPNISTLNAKAGQVVNNQTTVFLFDGIMKIYNSNGYTNVIVDVLGYYSANGDHFVSVKPTRIADTRAGTGTPYSGQTVAANGKLNVQLKGNTDPNLTNNKYATTAVVSVSVTDPKASGYLTLYASDVPQPNTSSLNYVPGLNLTKEVNVKLGADGAFSIANNSSGTTQIIVDVVGYFVQDEASNGESFLPASEPERITDTRAGSGQINAGKTLAADGYLNVKVKYTARIPAGASGVVYNLTALNGTSSTFLTSFPSGTGLPGTSNINNTAGQISFSQVTTKLGADGSFLIHNAAGTTDVIVDVMGYYYTNYNALSFYTNACTEGTSVASSIGSVIQACVARGSNTNVPPISGCAQGYYVDIRGHCIDANGNPAPVRNGQILTGNAILMNSDGSNQKQLNLTYGGVAIAYPKTLAWFASGQSFVFTDDSRQVYSANADGSNVKKLNLTKIYAASVSSDSRTMAILTAADSAPDNIQRIKLFNFSSNAIVKTFTFQASGLDIDWLPGDQKIFTSTHNVSGGYGEYCSIQISDEAKNCLDVKFSSYYSVRPSLDATKIVYEKRSTTTSEIRTSNFDGSNDVFLAGGPVQTIGFPTWAPDGKIILYRNLNGSTKDEIYQITLDPFYSQHIGTGSVQYLWQPIK